MTVLKQFGFGDRRIMEAKIQSEVNHLLKYVHARGGDAFYPADIFGLTSLNVMHDLMFSERFELGDPVEVYLRETIREFNDSSNPLFDIFPFAVYLPPYRSKLTALHPVSEKWYKFFQTKIHESVEKKDVQDNFVVEYMKKTGNNYDEKELIFILRDLIVAGTDTTSMQLSWAMVLLGNHPHVLRRLQADIDAVVPRDRLPSMGDRAKLPYVEAAILEAMRVRTIFPLSAPHVTLCDTEVAGFNIQANAEVC